MMSKHDYERLATVLRRRWFDARRNSIQLVVDELEKLVFAIVIEERMSNPKFGYTKEYEFLRQVFGVDNEQNLREKWNHRMEDNRNGR